MSSGARSALGELAAAYAGGHISRSDYRHQRTVLLDAHGRQANIPDAVVRVEDISSPESLDDTITALSGIEPYSEPRELSAYETIGASERHGVNRALDTRAHTSKRIGLNRLGPLALGLAGVLAVAAAIWRWPSGEDEPPIAVTADAPRSEVREVIAPSSATSTSIALAEAFLRAPWTPEAIDGFLADWQRAPGVRFGDLPATLRQRLTVRIKNEAQELAALGAQPEYAKDVRSLLAMAELADVKLSNLRTPAPASKPPTVSAASPRPASAARARIGQKLSDAGLPSTVDRERVRPAKGRNAGPKPMGDAKSTSSLPPLPSNTTTTSLSSSAGPAEATTTAAAARGSAEKTPHPAITTHATVPTQEAVVGASDQGGQNIETEVGSDSGASESLTSQSRAPPEPSEPRPPTSPPPSPTAAVPPRSVDTPTKVAQSESPSVDRGPPSSGPRLPQCLPNLARSRAICRDQLTAGDRGPRMVVLQGKPYIRGSSEREEERPAIRLQLDYVFAIAQHEVSVQEFKTFSAATSRPAPQDPWGDPFGPVVNVSWNDANAYANWLAEQTGKPYRLPSEGEWEFAARGGAATRYAFGDRIDKRRHVRYQVPGLQIDRPGARRGNTRRYARNNYKLYHMAGNVREWVADAWLSDHAQAPNNGQPVRNAGANLRVVRGGDYTREADAVRPASREPLAPDTRDRRTGFRIVVDLQKRPWDADR